MQKFDLPVRWTPLKNLHLTLRFLGEITNEQLDQACAFPAEELPSPFQLGVQGIGAFPTIRKPKVIWTGVQGETKSDHEALLGLQRTTEEWAQGIGLPAEQRSYTPHVTLGRVRGLSKEFERVLQSAEQEMGTSAPCTIRELILMQSKLSQAGALYSPIKQWELRS